MKTITIDEAQTLELKFQGRTYKVRLRAGSRFTVVPDKPGALPVCLYRMTMQKHVAKLFTRTADTKKPKDEPEVILPGPAAEINEDA